MTTQLSSDVCCELFGAWHSFLSFYFFRDSFVVCRPPPRASPAIHPVTPNGTSFFFFCLSPPTRELSNPPSHYRAFCARVPSLVVAFEGVSCFGSLPSQGLHPPLSFAAYIGFQSHAGRVQGCFRIVCRSLLISLHAPIAWRDFHSYCNVVWPCGVFERLFFTYLSFFPPRKVWNSLHFSSLTLL